MKVFKIFPQALFIGIALHGANAGVSDWGPGKQDVAPLDRHLESGQEHLIDRHLQALAVCAVGARCADLPSQIIIGPAGATALDCDTFCDQPATTFFNFNPRTPRGPSCGCFITATCNTFLVNADSTIYRDSRAAGACPPLTAPGPICAVGVKCADNPDSTSTQPSAAACNLVCGDAAYFNYKADPGGCECFNTATCNTFLANANSTIYRDSGAAGACPSFGLFGNTSYDRLGTGSLKNPNNAVVPVPNIEQLALGYNSLLGLLPSEQQGTYMRNPIFAFHLSPDQIFLMMNGQASDKISPYQVPLEYYVTAEMGDCIYTNTLQSTQTIYSSDDFSSVGSTRGVGVAPVKIKAGGSSGGQTLSVAEKLGIVRRMAAGDVKTTTTETKPKTGEVSGETEASAMFGNTKQAQNGVKASQEGFTKTVQTVVKRVYYTAGLRTWAFTKESFSLEFRIAAYLLGSSTYDFTQTMDFIYTWGNYVLDAAEMGATLNQGLYFTQATSSDEMSSIMTENKYNGAQFLLKFQFDSNTETKSQTVSGNTITYQTTEIDAVGQFSTMDIGSASDECRIGYGIIPQVIGFNIRPLWDTAIPIELFLDNTTTANFREYLDNATATQLEIVSSCLDSSGQSCTANNGTCVTDLNQQNGTYAVTCLPGPKAPIPIPPTNSSFSFQIYMINYFTIAGSENQKQYQDQISTSLYLWNSPNGDALATVTPPAPSNQVGTTDIWSIPKTSPNYNAYPISGATQTYQVQQSQVQGVAVNNLINQALEIIVCPVYMSPSTLAGTVYNGTCSMVFRVGYYGSHCNTKEKGLQFAVQFDLNNKNPFPSNTAFYTYDALTGGNGAGGGFGQCTPCWGTSSFNNSDPYSNLLSVNDVANTLINGVLKSC